MSINTHPIAAVCGGTGLQGLAVVKALAQAGYQVRVVTRDPENKKAQQLLQGIEHATLVKATFGDRAALESAFEGAQVVFGLTLADDQFLLGNDKTPGMPSEEEQGKLIVDVVKEKGVGKLVWSTVPPISSSTYSNLHHVVDKLTVETHINSLDVPVVFVQLGMFAENLLRYQTVVVEGDHLVYTLPHANRFDRVYPFLCVGADLGRLVATIVKSENWDKLEGRHLIAVERLYSANELTEIVEKVTGRKVVLKADEPFGVKGSHYDKMMHYFADRNAPYVDPLSLPDATLAALGFKFQPSETFVKTELAPSLGLKSSRATEE